MRKLLLCFLCILDQNLKIVVNLNITKHQVEEKKFTRVSQPYNVTMKEISMKIVFPFQAVVHLLHRGIWHYDSLSQNM